MTILKSTNYIADSDGHSPLETEGYPLGYPKGSLSRYIPMCRSISQYLREHCSRQRRKHSFEVARLAKALARRFGIHPAKGFLAGLAHNIAREMENNELLTLSATDGEPICKWEYERPILLHGRAAAIIIRNTLGFHEEQVLDAVRNHVVGKPGMSCLSKIIYIADCLEPNRNFFDDTFRKHVLHHGLNGMLRCVMHEIFHHLSENGKTIVPTAKILYEELDYNA